MPRGYYCFRSIFAEAITCYLYPHTKCSWRVMKEIPNQFHHGALTIIFLSVIFADKAFKTEKVGPTFSNFNPCPSLPFVTTDDRKQFQCLNIVLNNKTRPLFLKFN